MKLRVLLWIFSLALFLASVALLGADLPERVATHFGASGIPDGWMTRSAHVRFFSLFGIFFSSFVIGLTYLARFLPSSMLNVPHPEYWRRPEHYREACDYLFRHSFWFGTLSALWLTAFHYLLVQANRSIPAKLNLAGLGGLTIVFLAGTAVWAYAMIRHFARRPGTR